MSGGSKFCDHIHDKKADVHDDRSWSAEALIDKPWWNGLVEDFGSGAGKNSARYAIDDPTKAHEVEIALLQCHQGGNYTHDVELNDGPSSAIFHEITAEYWANGDSNNWACLQYCHILINFHLVPIIFHLKVVDNRASLWIYESKLNAA